jgi:hypothetical protein
VQKITIFAEKMKEQFALYNSLIDNLVLATETFPVEKGENMTTYFERLMRHINELKKKMIMHVF